MPAPYKTVIVKKESWPVRSGIHLINEFILEKASIAENVLAEV
ncbi:MAG: hypothetical protein ANABAC_2067 [Anaerolineae bacterium]|nr:MAG: hypothetical protein ANABAC_2067 [Anaerolineae bacterium]